MLLDFVLLSDKLRTSYSYLRFHAATSAENAEDVIQDSLLAILQAHTAHPTHIESPVAYANGIFRKKVAQHYKRAGRSRELPMFEDIEHSHLAGPDMALSLAVHQALHSIRRAHRDILIAYYFHDQTKEEICETSGITPTQFRILKNRAIDALRVAVLRK